MEQVKRRLVIKPSQCKEESYLARHHRVIADVGYVLEDYLDPNIWASIAPTINPHDIINIVCEDGSWFAQVFVVSAARQWIKVEVLIYKEFKDSTEEPGADQEYAVQWKGPVRRFCIVRVKDNSCVTENIQTKEEAIRACNDYITALGR